jgi:hypothetical protein
MEKQGMMELKGGASILACERWLQEQDQIASNDQ